MFPELEHIDQLLPAVEGRSDFIVKRRERYTVIDYVYTAADTFAEPLRLECRGIKFAPDGRLIARPFAKFFNIGERPETQPGLIDVGLPHLVMDKLDGSMVHPALLGDELVFMTRMGDTDIAKRALAFAEAWQPKAVQFCRELLAAGLTPIFEYTAPDNRIVIAYRDTALTLLAVRDNRTGEYLPLDAVPAGVPIVPHGEAITDLAHFMAATRDLQNAEGYVIRFGSGLMLKLKAADYVLRHKAKDEIGLEKNALRVVLEDADDDLLAVLPQHDADALRSYAVDVRGAIGGLVAQVDELLAAAAGVDRKTFAVERVPGLPRMLRPAAFQGYEGKNVRAAIIDFLVKQTSAGPKVDALREESGLPAWWDYWRPTKE